MPRKIKQRNGMTLTEAVVSISIIAIMIAAVIPASQVLRDSLHSSGAKSMISSALSAARALAARNQRYAGIRFQYDPNGDNQYMTFIVHDRYGTDLANGFRAIEGMKPVKLPEDQGVMEEVRDDVEIDDDSKLADKTTFSIVFTPVGKLVLHSVRVRRQNADDEIFNDLAVVDAMFQDDTNTTLPYKQELSVCNFVIYNKDEFSGINESSRYTDYLRYRDVFYINSYTGTIIE